MSRTRLTALLVILGLGAAGLVPAAAAPAPPAVAQLDPQRVVHAAAVDLLAAPDERRLGDLRGALTRGLRADTAVAIAEGPREWAYVSAAGDLDGDRRPDVMVQRDAGTVVRSGKDGRVLLRRGEGHLLPVSGAGPVRLLSIRYGFTETSRGFGLEVLLEGLDRTGRAVWEHSSGGTVSLIGAGPAYVARLDGVPAMLHDGLLDADGRPALMIAGLSATQTTAGSTSTVEPALLSLTDGTVTALPVVRGTGRALAWVFPVTAQGETRSCYGAAAPVGPLTRLSLLCDGAERWTSTVRLRDPYVQDAGDFDGDGLDDLVAGTYGFERPRPRELFRGTQVLSFADGSPLAASRVDTLEPLRRDVDGDTQPDFLELAYGDGLVLQAVTVAGESIWRRTVTISGDAYSLGTLLGLDLTGDGVGDGLIVSEVEKGPTTSVVVDGRTGRALTLRDVNGLLLPGLRDRGADLTVMQARAGRASATVLSGDTGRRLMAVTVPGPAGTVSPGSAGAVDVDGDRRRDLVVASRTGEQQVTTAFTQAGAVLWQARETAPRVELVLEGDATCC